MNSTTSLTPPREFTQYDSKILLEALPHPVLCVGPGGRFEYVNPSAENFFGIGSGLFLRSSIEDVFPVGSPIISLIEQAQQQNQSISEYGIHLAMPRVGAHTIDLQVAPTMDLPGAVVVMLQERTMAEKMDRQLTHRGAARSVTGVAAMLAHEIRNPLAGIRGAAQLLEQSVTEMDAPLTTLICEETDRICRLVDRMEVFSDHRLPDREPVNIHHVLDRVKQAAATGFASDFTIQEYYDPSLPPVVGNRDQLVQVFLNLVKNAAEALKDRTDGMITLRTAFRPGVHMSVPGSGERVSLPLLVEIEDNGNGIPDDLLPYLFDPFVTTKTNGTGLGLALVAKIIGDHGGIVECDSEEGRTVFRAFLPVQTSKTSE